jgi:aspartate racemase
MKTLGVIGGIAPASTIEYYRMLIAGYQARRPDGSNPPVIINSIDMQTMLRLIAADALDEVTSYLAAEIEKLARGGAELGLLASNTPHVVFDRLARVSAIPLISIVETAFAAARALGLTRVGLLGTRFTMQSVVYPSVFAPRGIAVVVPDAASQDYVHGKYMGELVRGEYLPETKAGIVAVIAALRAAHAIDGVILGGTELPLLLRDMPDVGVPLLDTGRIHVDAALEAILEEDGSRGQRFNGVRLH